MTLLCAAVRTVWRAVGARRPGPAEAVPREAGGAFPAEVGDRVVLGDEFELDLRTRISRNLVLQRAIRKLNVTVCRRETVRLPERLASLLPDAIGDCGCVGREPKTKGPAERQAESILGRAGDSAQRSNAELAADPWTMRDADRIGLRMPSLSSVLPSV